MVNNSGTVHSYELNHWNGRSRFNIVDNKINKVVKSLNFNEDINFLTRVNYKNLLLKVSLKKNPLFFRPILNAHKLCININKKILKNDFK
jgi:hypothetical protein